MVHQPSAVVFHDKRLKNDGGWLPSTAEIQYSAEAGLLLPYKYSREDLTESYLEIFRNASEKHLVMAAQAYDARVRDGRLPTQIDSEHAVGQFIDDGYVL